MPHIVFESSSEMLHLLDFPVLMGKIHRAISAAGYAQLDDFKSRVHVCEATLVGVDPDAEFVIARLITTNPRPVDVQQKMASILHDILRASIQELEITFWWQCCVLIEHVEQGLYLKTNSRPRSSVAPIVPI